MIRLGNGFPIYGWEANPAGREALAEMRKTAMKKNLRGKIREFIASEEGKVGVKGPLTLGIATGSILLAHAVVGTHSARAVVGAWCEADADCRPGRCDLIDCTEPDGAKQVTCWGVCRD